MILHHIFEDLIEGFEPRRPPQPSKKPTFWKYWKSFWKLLKVGGSEGEFVISNPPKWFYISLFIDIFIWGSKELFSPKNQYLKIWERAETAPLPQKGLMLVKIFYFIYIPIFHSENENLQYSWGQAIFQLIISLSQSF